MKKIIPVLILMLIGSATATYAQDCYESTRNKAISLFNQGKKSQAKNFFEAAKACPDKPANNDLETWINKCAVTDGSTQIKSPKISVETILLSNPSGLTSSHSDANYYTDELLNFAPKLIIDNSSKSNIKSKISIVITDPEGNVLTTSHSGQYSETKEVSLKPGFNELFFGILSSYDHTPITGDYTCTVWVDGKQAKETTWNVSTRPTTLAVNGKSSDFDLAIGCNAGSQTFSVSTNAKSFEVKHKPSWITIDELSSNSITLSYSSNPGHDTREGKMDIYTSDGKRSLIINLIQDGNPALADRFGSRMFKDMRMKISLGFCMPDFTAKASNELGSVIDYGVTDVPSLAYLEAPNYKTLTGFSVAFGLDMPLTKSFFIETGLGFQFLGIKNVFSNDQLKYTVSGRAYYLDYGCTERYAMTYLQIPLLAGYKLSFNSKSSMRFNAGLDFGIGLTGKCNLHDGYANYTYSDDTYSYYGNSTYSGYVNLYTGQYEIHQQYSTGQSPSYTYSSRKLSPYKRFNLGLHLGASYCFSHLEVGASYSIGLTNIGNQQYFGSTNRVGGCLFVGETISSEQGIYGYKQHVNNFQIFLSYWF